ncbi:HAD-IA family hydrolase [Agrilactobacillus fermenti]|uniref:HAD-IA family hydrolase n=1 Tax=Agrilactobacillus fermenti TaxID=2586909 RepID=UPI001E3E9624|nr:HAD-IA family hydrolase [Agrilactobacillus fermenti]MCD2255800.1 HAD-IA family hydrolase [Agrilactobacillus fermenti]
MQLDNFIWDFDGTLFDTYGPILQSFQQALSDFGLHFDKNELYKLIKKESIGFAIDHFHQVYGVDNNALNKHYHKIEFERQSAPKPFEDTVAVIKSVVNANKQNFLYTHRDNHVFDFLENYDLKNKFVGCVTSDGDFPRKPDPSALNYLIQTYNLEPTRTAMIGDRAIDVVAGKNANIHTIYFDVDQFHDDHHADAVVQRLQQITQYI